jgi:hypothetical protein
MEICDPENCLIVKDLNNKLEYMDKKLDKITDAVIGDPSDNNKPGHSLRLDRLERSSASVKKVLGVISGALISIGVIVVANTILKYWL